ncbi:MAG: hypothetical protein RL265_603, partial [Bacteroidota bacterium]
RILFDDESTQNSNNQAENKQIDGNSEV